MHSQEKFESVFENPDWEQNYYGNGKISVGKNKFTQKVLSMLKHLIIKMQKLMQVSMLFNQEKMLKMI